MSNDIIEILEQEEYVVEIEVDNYDSSGKLPDYTGTYQVTPRKQQIVLPTKDKSMTDDVTVYQIPYASVPNTSGGYTVTIGIE